jgi:phage shock protein A
MTQVRKQEIEQRDLRAKTTANLRAGNRDAAGQYAIRLQSIEKDLEENRKQLEQAETTYKDLVRARDVSVTTAKAKIEALRSSISDMKMKKAMAELTEMASGMITTIGGSGDTLDRLQGMVEQEREKAAGRMRVAKDNLDTSGLVMKEHEQKALADQALADFAAKEGIALDPAPTVSETTASPSTVKTMGPSRESA